MNHHHRRVRRLRSSASVNSVNTAPPPPPLLRSASPVGTASDSGAQEATPSAVTMFGQRLRRLSVRSLLSVMLVGICAVGSLAALGVLPSPASLGNKSVGDSSAGSASGGSLFGNFFGGSSSDSSAASAASSTSSASTSAASAATSATPQLSKEYIYAGSRLLAVEDAGAVNSPPPDLAVFRQSNGIWYVRRSDGSYFGYQFGTSGDIPSVGDFDSDGKNDFCVFRPSTGTWFVMKSATETLWQQPFGISSDKPAVADYDGDGRADLAVTRSANQAVTDWYILRSSDSSITGGQYGTAQDTPAPAATTATDAPISPSIARRTRLSTGRTPRTVRRTPRASGRRATHSLRATLTATGGSISPFIVRTESSASGSHRITK